MLLHFIWAHVNSRTATVKTYRFVWRKDELFKVAQRFTGKVITKINTDNVVTKDISIFKGKW